MTWLDFVRFLILLSFYHVKRRYYRNDLNHFWINLWSGPIAFCFSHRWLLLGARKLTPKNLKTIFFQDKFYSFKGSCILLKLGIFTHFTFTDLPRCSQSINSLIYVYSILIPCGFLWVLDHSHDLTSSYYRRPKNFSV